MSGRSQDDVNARVRDDRSTHLPHIQGIPGEGGTRRVGEEGGRREGEKEREYKISAYRVHKIIGWQLTWPPQTVLKGKGREIQW